MSILVAVSSLLSLLAGFDLPIFKEGLKDRVTQIEVCADGGCYER